MTGLDLSFRLTGDGPDLEIRQTLPLDGLTAVFGPSGAGKSTLLRAIAGFVPTGGRIRFDGETWEDGRTFIPPHRRRIGFVTQAPALFAHLDVAGNLAYAARRSGALPEVAATLDRFGLAPLALRRPATLSGGEAQRVALARALLSRPRLLLLDEPLSALDAGRRAEILPLIEALRDEARLPILYVSHSLAEVARLATRTLALAAGRVRGFGATADLLALPEAAPAFGETDPASLVEATVAAHEADGLTRLALPAGSLLVPAIAAAPGTRLRLIVRARDVMIATGTPQGLSALNILPARVTVLRPLGKGATEATLAAAGVTLRAQLTDRSVRALALTPGADCHAIVKSVALARE
jgi:molybdate transport system ATP-binding protein